MAIYGHMTVNGCTLFDSGEEEGVTVLKGVWVNTLSRLCQVRKQENTKEMMQGLQHRFHYRLQTLADVISPTLAFRMGSRKTPWRLTVSDQCWFIQKKREKIMKKGSRIEGCLMWQRGTEERRTATKEPGAKGSICSGLSRSRDETTLSVLSRWREWSQEHEPEDV